jgi:ring-1,2-phenylacetyl-CoA epoxidase subunit PaaA
MSTAVPLCEKLGFSVPAYFSDEHNTYVIDCPFPARFDSQHKRWLLDEGQIEWTEVLQRWRARGPMNEQYVETIQRGRRGLEELRSGMIASTDRNTS